MPSNPVEVKKPRPHKTSPPKCVTFAEPPKRERSKRPPKPTVRVEEEEVEEEEKEVEEHKKEEEKEQTIETREV